MTHFRLFRRHVNLTPEGRAYASEPPSKQERSTRRVREFYECVEESSLSLTFGNAEEIERQEGESSEF